MIIPVLPQTVNFACSIRSMSYAPFRNLTPSFDIIRNIMIQGKGSPSICRLTAENQIRRILKSIGVDGCHTVRNMDKAEPFASGKSTAADGLQAFGQDDFIEGR